MVPTTSDYLRFHARHRPAAIALVDDGREIDYATFERDLASFARAMGEFGLRRGQFVAVACEGFYVHWLLLLACENLGLGTTSFLPDERGTLGQMMPHVEMVLCSSDVPDAAGKRFHRVTREWLDGVFAGPVAGASGFSAGDALGIDDPQRLVRSSGTTGGFKMMVNTRRHEEGALARQAMSVGFTPQSRLLLSTPFTVPSTHRRATGALRLGAACIRDARISLERAIVTYRPTHVRLFQFQMKQVLDRLPEGFRKPADLTVMVAAAPLSESMRQRLLDRLASSIIYSYGANETGTIMLVGEDGICTPRPGVEIGVVDGDGRPLPPGETGEVRVRTEGMVSGYLDNAELSARVFRDGWFHTGDTGALLPSGRLKLIGRANEVLNIGGVKIAPAAIEEIVEREVDVEDVAVTSKPNSEGVEELCIAMVVKDRPQAARDGLRVAKSLPKSLGRVHFMPVDSIPRTEETGKVRREALKKLFAPK